MHQPRQIRHILLRAAFCAATSLAGCAPAFAQTHVQPIAPADRDIAPRLVVSGPLDAPVRLEAVRISADLAGSFALTDVELVFRNPNRRVLEGELQFPLIGTQQVVGFALDVDGRMREAVTVEKVKGQQVFEDIVRRGIDPGLLEATQGNNYKLRLYPLPAQGTRTVRLRIAEVLAGRAGERRFRMALAYGTQVPEFSLSIQARGATREPVIGWRNPGELRFVRERDGYAARLERRDFAAVGFIEVALRQPQAAATWIQELAGERYFYAEARIRERLKERSRLARVLPETIALVWDSSASGAAREHQREFALLDAYFKAMGEGNVHLVRVRDSVDPAESFRIARGDWRALRSALEQTVYDGATNLGALRSVAGAQETLLFSDGLANYGEAAAPRLEGRVFTISAAVRSNPALLRHVAFSSGADHIDLIADSRAVAADKLLLLRPRILRIVADGAREVFAASPFAADGQLALAGVLTGSEATLQIEYGVEGGTPQVQAVRVRSDRNSSSLAAHQWARMKVEALEAEFDLNRGEIRRIGKAFGLVTRETSLIVLERAEDYARHEISPPAELRAAVERLMRDAQQRGTAERHSHLERIVRLFEEKQAWWSREFPKGPRPAPAGPRKDTPSEGAAIGGRASQLERRESAPESRRAAPAMAAPKGQAAITIQLKRWTPDAPYIRRMREADVKDLYRIYLDERGSYAGSTAFFLDAADMLFEKGLEALGLRALSNLAEMDLENRHILRILGGRLMQAGRPGLAIPVLRKVLKLSPAEPQSWRDLGLAYAADRQIQKAVDALHEVVVRPWHGRFPEVELITLAELNALIANAAEKPDASRIDPRLLRNLPLDLRVVLAWDADNTDIDLWVTDPNGEKAFYGNRLTYQGGRMSQDFTGGYGPEEFSLKKAKPGVYRIEAQFYGHRQQIVAGATTLQLKLQTEFGTPWQQDKLVTLRLKGQREVVFVGEFEVK